MSNPVKNVSKRAPIVAIVGHVDHGKSSLLDYIRKSNVVDGEAGGITQHISAYEVNWKTSDGKESPITFLDTPGHAAFSSMRERGVDIADIAILVVSAEDGAKPQTKESWKAIEKSGLPCIVAINKIDKPSANLDMVKNSLSDIGIFVEGWGGTVPFVGISAKMGTNIDELLDLIVIQSEIIDLSFDANEEGSGVILESFVDSKRGISATLIVKKGKVHAGSTIQVEDATSPTRIMENFLGKTIKEASAGEPIKITGFNKVPETGKTFTAHDKKRDAEDAASIFAQAIKNGNIFSDDFNFTEDFALPIIIKADTYGSLEAIEKEILAIKIDGVRFKIIQKDVGLVMEKDVSMASIDKTCALISFHTGIDKKAIETADRLKVKINSFDIIYKMSEWLSVYAEAARPKTEIEEVAGSLKIIRVFNRSKTSQVVGGKVFEGYLKNHGTIRIMRKETIIGKGKIIELQSFKQEVDEVKEGNDCGLMIDSKYDIAEGDTLQLIIKKIV